MDGTARIWDTATARPIGEPFEGHDGAVLSAAFSPDGKRIVTASNNGTARVWDIAADGQKLISLAEAEIPRCLTPAQHIAFFLSVDPPTWCVQMSKWPYDTRAFKEWHSDRQWGLNLPPPVE